MESASSEPAAMSEPAPAPEIRRIGIIGAGQMGRGIAHVCALAGLDVLLTDISPEALAAGRETIDRNLSRQVARGRIREEDKAAALGRIGMAADYAAFADCDMVIEAATRTRGGQARDIYQSWCRRCGPTR